MRRLVIALPIVILSAGPPPTADDFALMVGLRSTLASSIRDGGYRCPDVKELRQIGYDEFGAILKVVCGPLDSDEAWRGTPFRVTAYLEGDFSVEPWPGVAAR